MKKQILVGGSAAALVVILCTSAFGLRGTDPQDRSSQNIERDSRAYEKARNRDFSARQGRRFHRGREARSMDGSNNNESNNAAGASFQQFQRMMPNDYGDGISSMSGVLRKSAREVSNIVVAQGDRSVPNKFGTSDFLWQWGQFMDHDITLGDEVPSADRSFDIAVPHGDPFFDPSGSGDQVIHFNRALYAPETGTDLENPRQHLNEITSWIDGSMVYGNNDERANALRTLDGTGRLRTSGQDLLPLNSNGLPNADGPAPDPAKLFLAGDVRSNEQVGLTVMHTLFMREHNRWAEKIRRTRRYYSGDDIYQAARRMVIAEIQIITYNEYLPALIGPDAIPAYRGYEPGDATIFAEFSGAAYRLGHSQINTKLLRLNKRGREISRGHLSLRNAFFSAPSILKKRADLEPILRGLAAQKSQRIDNMIVDDLRNFLFGAPGAGGFDLAALNIQRGRDRGIPSYNDAREAMGLGRVSDFDEITSDTKLQQALFEAYGSVDDIDLWVGGICEDPMWRKGSQLGPLFRYIIAYQFQALRDHDRFWHQNDLTLAEYNMVRSVRLAKIIKANTNIRGTQIPRDVFYVK